MILFSFPLGGLNLLKENLRRIIRPEAIADNFASLIEGRYDLVKAVVEVNDVVHGVTLLIKIVCSGFLNLSTPIIIALSQPKSRKIFHF